MRKILFVTAVGIAAGCAHPQPLVDWRPFDPKAGVLWAEPGQAATGAALKKAHPILVMDVTIVDGTGANPTAKQDILIEKGLITQIAPTGEIIPPKGTERIKGSGATAMPGLVDVLVFTSSGSGPHWNAGNLGEGRVLQASLYNGVTTVAASGNLDALAETRDRIKRGEEVGPQLFLAAPYVTVKNGFPAELPKRGRKWWQLGPLAPAGDAVREINNPTDARNKINAIADLKANVDIIPVVFDGTPAAFPKMSADSLRTILDRTHSRGRKALVFTGTLDDVVHAVGGKADGIIHGVYAEELNEENAHKLAAVLQASGVPLMPALAELWGQGNAVAGTAFPAVALERETAEPDVVSAFAKMPPKQKGMLFKYASTVGPQLPVAASNLGKILTWKSEGGAKPTLIAFGGSAWPGVFPGAALHRELELMVKAGVPPLEAIAAATSRPARLLRDEPKFGSIAPGLRADILLVDGDVVADITNTQRIRAVIVGGRVVDRIAIGKMAERAKEKGEAKDSPAAEGDGKTAAPKKKKNTGVDEEPPPM